MKEIHMYTGKFFEVSGKMLKTQEDGTEKMEKETIVVEANSFGDAENRALAEFYGCDVDVVSVGIAPYKDVFLSDDGEDDKFYKAKLEFVSLDEDTNKVHVKKFVCFVQANTIGKALAYIDKHMSSSMIDYVSVAASETSIEDVFLKQTK